MSSSPVKIVPNLEPQSPVVKALLDKVDKTKLEQVVKAAEPEITAPAIAGLVDSLGSSILSLEQMKLIEPFAMRIAYLFGHHAKDSRDALVYVIVDLYENIKSLRKAGPTDNLADIKKGHLSAFGGWLFELFVLRNRKLNSFLISWAEEMKSELPKMLVFPDGTNVVTSNMKVRFVIKQFSEGQQFLDFSVVLHDNKTSCAYVLVQGQIKKKGGISDYIKHQADNDSVRLPKGFSGADAKTGENLSFEAKQLLFDDNNKLLIREATKTQEHMYLAANGVTKGGKPYVVMYFKVDDVNQIVQEFVRILHDVK